MQVSAERITANQQNAQKSTGPVTPAGKARAALNAQKRGLLARNVVLTNDVARESRDELDHFIAELRSDLLPSGALEDALVERIATCHWRLARAHRFETYALDNGHSDDPKTAEVEQLRDDLAKAEESLENCTALEALYERPAESLLPDERRQIEDWEQEVAAADARDEADYGDESEEEEEEEEDDAEEDDEEDGAEESEADDRGETAEIEETEENDDEEDSSDEDDGEESDDAADDTSDSSARRRLDAQIHLFRSRIASLTRRLGKAEYKLAQRTLRSELTSLLPQSADLLDLVRYESMLDRQLHRALSELHRLRAMHGDRPGPRRHLRSKDEDSAS